MIKVLLVIIALWLCIELSVSKESMLHNNSCTDRSDCMGGIQ